MTAIRRNFGNQISTTIPQPYDPLNLGLPGTGQLSPIAYERLMMQGGRYLSGLGQAPHDGPEENPMDPTIYALDDEPDWRDSLPFELQDDDDSVTSGIFDGDGTASTNVDMGVFADHWAIPGYIARNPPFYINPEVQDITADAIVLEVPAGGMAYLEKGGKNAPPVISPWGRMSPYAYQPCVSQHHPRQPNSWAPRDGRPRAPMPMTPDGGGGMYHYMDNGSYLGGGRGGVIYDWIGDGGYEGGADDGTYDGSGGEGDGGGGSSGGVPPGYMVPGSNVPVEPWQPEKPRGGMIPSALGPMPVRQAGRPRHHPHPHPHQPHAPSSNLAMAIRSQKKGAAKKPGPGADVRGFGHTEFQRPGVPLVSSWDPLDVTPIPYSRARGRVPFNEEAGLSPFQSIVEPLPWTAPIYPGIGQEPAPAPAPAPTQASTPPSTGLGTYFVAGIVAGTAVALFASAMGGKKKA
jgi:hypothetical protein